jgi:hypothetical protein
MTSSLALAVLLLLAEVLVVQMPSHTSNGRVRVRDTVHTATM